MSNEKDSPCSVKGTAILGLLKAIDRSYGKEGLAATLAAAPLELGKACEFREIVAVGWYSGLWYGQLLRAARTALREDAMLAWRLSHDATREDFRGIFAVAIRLLSPQTIFRHARRLLLFYWRGGTVDVPEVRSGYGRLNFAGWEGFDENIWLDMLGGIVALLEVVGAKDVRWKILAGGDDSDHMDVEVRWS
jgi:hypothetical protein